MSERGAGRQYQGCKILPRYLPQVRRDEPGLLRLGEPFGSIVAGDHFGAARLQGLTTRKPGSAQPEHRNGLAREAGDGNHTSARPSGTRVFASTRKVKIPGSCLALPGMTIGGCDLISAASAWRARPTP